MRRQSKVDLSQYALQHASASRCTCGARVHLLGPRVGFATKPIYYLCATCGAIFQAGCKDTIAPKEDDR
jgi:hypothetical protein